MVVETVSVGTTSPDYYRLTVCTKSGRVEEILYASYEKPEVGEAVRVRFIESAKIVACRNTDFESVDVV